MTVTLLSLFGCATSMEKVPDDLTCGPGSETEEVLGTSLRDEHLRWQAEAPVVVANWSRNPLGVPNDELSIDLTHLSEPRVCVSHGANFSASGTVSVEAASDVWPSTGTYQATLAIDGGAVRLMVPMDVVLPSAYRAAAQVILEETWERSFAADEVPNTVGVDIYLSTYASSEELPHDSVEVWFRGEQIAPLLYEEPDEMQIANARTLLASASSVD